MTLTIARRAVTMARTLRAFTSFNWSKSRDTDVWCSSRLKEGRYGRSTFCCKTCYWSITAGKPVFFIERISRHSFFCASSESFYRVGKLTLKSSRPIKTRLYKQLKPRIWEWLSFNFLSSSRYIQPFSHNSFDELSAIAWLVRATSLSIIKALQVADVIKFRQDGVWNSFPATTPALLQLTQQFRRLPKKSSS